MHDIFEWNLSEIFVWTKWNLTKDPERKIDSEKSMSAIKESYLVQMKISCEDWRSLTQSNTWDTDDKQKSVKINVKSKDSIKTYQIFVDEIRAAC